MKWKEIYLHLENYTWLREKSHNQPAMNFQAIFQNDACRTCRLRTSSTKSVNSQLDGARHSFFPMSFFFNSPETVYRLAKKEEQKKFFFETDNFFPSSRKVLPIWQ